MKDREILAGVPSGRTVSNEVGALDGNIVYVSNNNGNPCKVFCKGDSGIDVWCHSDEDYDLMHLRNRRSLSDIQRIVELEDEKNELEIMCDKAHDLISSLEESGDLSQSSIEKYNRWLHG